MSTVAALELIAVQQHDAIAADAPQPNFHRYPRDLPAILAARMWLAQRNGVAWLNLYRRSGHGLNLD